MRHVLSVFAYISDVHSQLCIDKLAMVASTVSSKMIEAMAAKEGFKFTECLTGSC